MDDDMSPRVQVTADQLKRMSAEEIIEAQDKGRLNALLGRRATGTGVGQA